MKKCNLTFVIVGLAGLLTGGCGVFLDALVLGKFPQSKVSFVDLVERVDTERPVEWVELKKGDKHIGAALVQDETQRVARMYAYLKINDKWTLKGKVHVPFTDRRLDYVSIDVRDSRFPSVEATVINSYTPTSYATSACAYIHPYGEPEEHTEELTTPQNNL